jgi:hypothetical protein
MFKQVSEQCFGEPRKNLGGLFHLLGVLITVLPFRLLKIFFGKLHLNPLNFGHFCKYPPNI